MIAKKYQYNPLYRGPVRLLSVQYNGYDLYVNSNDNGKKPHFHVEKDLDKPKKVVDCCIRIDDNRYFLHGDHIHPLRSNKEIKNLFKILKSHALLYMSNRNALKDETVWQCFKRLWNNGNRTRIPDSITFVNYSTIKMG